MNDELMHYGIKGQKWGVRRFQNEDGTLTPAGRKKYKQEIKAENKKAFEIGREATIASNAAYYAKNINAKSQKKLQKALTKDPNMEKRSTQRKYKRSLADAKSEKELTAYAKVLETKAKRHCDSLIKKYGSENVKNIKYIDHKTKDGKNVKVMNERVITGEDFATAVLAGTVTSMVTGHMIIFGPRGGAERGMDMARQTIRTNRKSK